MPLNEFWHGDMRLLSAYQIAYLRKTDYEAWKNGAYANIGISIAISNSFRNKCSKPEIYPNWKDPIPKKHITKLTKENLEIKFRKEQIENNNWLHNLIQKHKKG